MVKTIAYYKALYKLANNYERKLVANCNRINGMLAENGYADSIIVLQAQRLANTIFVDTHKNIFTEIKRLFAIDKNCTLYGLENGLYRFFHRPNRFIRLGKALLA